MTWIEYGEWQNRLPEPPTSLPVSEMILITASTVSEDSTWSWAENMELELLSRHWWSCMNALWICQCCFHIYLFGQKLEAYLRPIATASQQDPRFC
jgi:hypothetical protein